jgi:peptidoglycan/xylan/chitin deacetylase (PgdA/CDA1 family)
MHPYLYELILYFSNGYPPFVYKINPKPVINYIPVFILHSVSYKEFEEKLIFLKENSYHTCTVSELYSFVKNDKKPFTPTVCLTFDDGHKSLYDTAFPLLRKYNFTATAFITPAFIGNPNWAKWQEIEEISKSGIIEIQSHTLEHKRIFIDNKISGYSYNGLFKNDLGLDRPTIVINGKETKEIPIGFPLHKMDSRMSKKLRHFGDGRVETLKEQEEAILYDLMQSKKVLEEKINKPVIHLAYPWGTGSHLSQQLSKKAGYLTNFWGALPFTPYNKAGCDLFKLVRLKDDYIFRLPGNKRKSLFEIFSLKSNRRKKANKNGGDIY